MSKFPALTSLVIIATATALAACWPHALASARGQAQNLIGEAASADLAEASADFHLATWLDPTNVPAYLGLARAQIANGQASAAILTLNGAGKGTEAVELRVRTLLELGRYSAAADSSAVFARPYASESEHLLAAVAYKLAGRTSDLGALAPSVTAPEAAQRILRIQSGNLPLATELYASGLPESSRALLLKLPTSYERNLLLARIYAAHQTPADLALAQDYLTDATALNPGGLEAHQLLAQVYASHGKPSESAAQNLLAKHLQAGRP